eukprot:gene2230-4330_t
MATNKMRIRTIPSNANPTPRPSTSKDGRRSEFVDPMKKNSTVEEDFQHVLDNIIGEDFFHRLLQTDNLTTIQELKVIIDTSIQSIDDIGDMMPNLRSLHLDNSNILSLRDLGITLRNIISLSLNNCHITELDGIGSFVDLQILSLRDNIITDICPLAMLENLKDVDLHGNKISNLIFTDALSSCHSLESLRLTRNPVIKAPKYHIVVASLIPALKYLDGKAIDEFSRHKVTHTDVLEASSALRMLKEELEDEERMEGLIMDEQPFIQSQQRQQGQVQGQGQGGGQCYSSSNNNNNIPPSSGSGSSSSSLLPDTGSVLTHGSSVVLVGGMAAALRQRRAKTTSSIEEPTALHLLDAALLTSQHSQQQQHHRASSSPGSPHHLSGFGSSAAATTTSAFQFHEGDVTDIILGEGLQDTSIGYARMMARAMTAPDRSGSGSISVGSKSTPIGKYDPKRTSNNNNNNNNNSPNEITRPMTGMASSSSSSSRTGNGNGNGLNSSANQMRPSSAEAAPSAPFKVPLARPVSRHTSTATSIGRGGTGTGTGVSSSAMSLNTDHHPMEEPPHSNLNKPVNIISKGIDVHNENLDTENDDENKDDNNDDMRVGCKNNYTSISTTSTIKRKSVGNIINQNHSHGSIACRDVVFRRTKPVSSSESNGGNGRGNSNGNGSNEFECDANSNSEDEEDIAVNHASRHRLMASSGRMGRAMMAISEPAVEQDNYNNDDNDDDESLQQVELCRSLAAVSSVNRQQQLQRGRGRDAGRSLGFDLKGSLAAIEQWVDAMDSSQSDNEDTEEGGGKGVRGGVRSGGGVDRESEDEDMAMMAAMVSGSGSGTGGKIKNKNKEDKKKEKEKEKGILSREKIMSMCLGDTDEVEVEDIVPTSTSSKPRNKRLKDKKSRPKKSEPDILVIDHDASYDNEITDSIEQYNKNNNKIISQKHSKKVTTTATATNSSQRQKYPYQYNDVIIDDNWDGYGDMEEALMMDFNMNDNEDDENYKGKEKGLGGSIEYNNNEEDYNYNDYNDDKDDDEEKDDNDNIYTDIQMKTTTKQTSAKTAVVSSSHKTKKEQHQLQHQHQHRVSPPKTKVKILTTSSSNTPSVSRKNKNNPHIISKIRTKYGAVRPNRLQNKTEEEEEEVDMRTHNNRYQQQEEEERQQYIGDERSSLNRLNRHQSHTHTQSHSQSQVQLSQEAVGEAINLDDRVLIALLNKPPKSTKELRTKTSFQEFFRGMNQQRMRNLLENAYSDLNGSDKQIQVEKRLKLLRDVLV